MAERQQLGTGTDVARETILRPHRHLFSRGVVAVLALTTPVFAVLYWLTVPSGSWPWVLLAHVLTIAVLVLGVYSYFSTTITLGPEGVRVNAILPGMVVTERQLKLWLTEDGMAAMRDRQCLKRNLSPADIVGPCLFLASSASAGMTAQWITVDGGVL